MCRLLGTVARASTTLWRAFALAACVLALTGAFAANARGTPPIVQVEEDWELVVESPDADSQAPQVTSIMSPLSDLTGKYFALDMNHQSLPEYHGGGMQVQVWEFDEPSLSQNFPNGDTLYHENETVTWTQRLTLANGVLTFEVVHGASETWGAFGGDDLRISTSAEVDNLNGYSPSVTRANSGVGYASNRVKHLKLKAVRYYSATGLVSEDNSPHSVYEHQE